MSKEAQFKVEMEIPRTPRDKYVFKSYLKSLQSQVGVFGRNGSKVGLGFVWETHTALANGHLNILSKRMQRALKASGLLDRLCDPYFLEQRIDYIRDGEPSVTFQLKED